jgi:hypothetical protein
MPVQSSAWKAREVLLLHPRDPLAVCFAALITRRIVDTEKLKMAVELGFPLAQARLSLGLNGGEKLALAVQAVQGGERDGHYALGQCFMYGDGVGRDKAKAREHFLIAVKMVCNFFLDFC